MKIVNNRISEHFSHLEMTRSALALRRGIINDPGPHEIANLTCLAKNILELVRQHYGIPFSPLSGYRSLALNQLVGSKPTSQHIKGQAVDFQIPTIANRDLAEWIRDHLTFDQLILEFHCLDDPQSGWVHCSYSTEFNRKQSLIFDGTNFKEF